MRLTSLRPGYAGWGGALYLLAQGSVATSGVALPLLAAFCALASLRGRLDFAIRPTPTEWAMLGFVAVWSLASWLGLDPTRSFGLSMPMWGTLLLAVAVGREREATHAIHAIVLVLALLCAVWSIEVIRLLAAPDPTVDPLSALENTGGVWLVVPNDLGFAMVLWPLWFRMANATTHPIASLLVAASLFCACVGALWMLQSRLGLLMGALVLVWILLQTRCAWVKPVLFVAMLALLSAAVWLWSMKSGDSIVVRLELWRTAWALMLDHPWTGVGPHNFASAHLEHFSAQVRTLDPRIAPWPHSLPLEVAAETGWLGCCAFGALLVCAAPRGWAGANRRAVLGSAMLFVFMCFVEASTLRAWWWALVAVALASSNRYWIGKHASKELTAPKDGALRIPGREHGDRGFRRD